MKGRVTNHANGGASMSIKYPVIVTITTRLFTSRIAFTQDEGLC
ncbi:hypothetical protein AB4391_01295 [Vibrio lentus]|nr:hypothetical protein [Vibrio lentus]